MYVCLCRSVTEADVGALVAGGACSALEVIERSGASTGCGGCRSALFQVLAGHGLVVEEADPNPRQPRISAEVAVASATDVRPCVATSRSSSCSTRCLPPS